MSDDHLEVELDATGLLCPLPVLKARKKLQAMQRGQILVLRATDAMSVIDVPHFCNEQGHHLLEQSKNGQEYLFRIRRA
jgi:tRNA 2-thiouridine synthesizing protein A